MGRRTQDDDDDEDDDALWEIVTRTVKPLARRKQPRTTASAKPAAVKMPASSGTAAPPPLPARPNAAPPGKGFDRATATRLKKGKLPLEGRIDLHGMTQAEAYEALHRFIRRAYANGLRTLLVITGKGRVGGGGVLRRMVPLWLDDSELRGIVLATTTAQAKDGGEGALYVRLKNPEKK